MMIDDTERREKPILRGIHRRLARRRCHWPVALFEKHGSRLGGNTGPFALRTIGVDTFLLTQDVEEFLRSHGIVDRVAPASTHSKPMNVFNDLREQSGKSLAVSRISFVTDRTGSGN